ncbi:hypothetical protein ACFW7J_33725, partial [Streptomyces sp. NPDC059525]
MTEMEIVAERGEWRSGFEERLLAAYRGAGCPEPLARALRERAVKGIEDWTVATDGTGWVAVGVADEDGVGVGRIHDLTAARGRAWAERWCAEQGAERVVVRLTGGAGAFADYPVRGQNRMRTVAENPELASGPAGRPPREGGCICLSAPQKAPSPCATSLG